MTARTAHTRSAIDSQLMESHSTHPLWASLGTRSRVAIGLHPIDDAAAPVRNQQSPPSVDQQGQRVLEAGCERDDSAGAAAPTRKDYSGVRSYSAEMTAVAVRSALLEDADRLARLFDQ